MARLQPAKDFYLSFKFVTSFASLLRLLYPRFEYAAALTIFSLLAAGAYEVVNYHSGTIIGSFYSALLTKDEPKFWNLFWKATLIYFGQCLLLATTTFACWLLNIAIRKNLVTALHKYYYRNNTYHKLNSVDNIGIDNPLVFRLINKIDQRITQDAERMCSMLSKNIYPYVLICPGVIGFYTWRTWATAGPFGVGLIYGYFIIGVIANRLIVSPITKWTARAEKSEGDFSYAIQLFPIFVFHAYDDMSPSALAKQISNNAFYFIYLINSFTRLTDLAMYIGEMAGYSQRLSELLSYMKRVWEDDTIIWEYDDDSVDSVDLFHTENLCYAAPSDLNNELVSVRERVPGLTLRVPKCKTLLITGKSGVGKTSLLRMLKKLWKPSMGNLLRNFTHDNTMFLPQRPYFPTGQLSLRQQILFPRIESEESAKDDNKILDILQSLKIWSLVSMCGGLNEPSNFEWQETLSPGEQQRLSLARVLYHQPSYVFLDEATSSLSLDAETEVYSLLKQVSRYSFLIFPQHLFSSYLAFLVTLICYKIYL
uniref:ABC transporter domain-containing protein n=1 Tax=Angiostrongylus cantonensis TaxID=6313 RepID=A0A158P9U1_ANGCA